MKRSAVTGNDSLCDQFVGNLNNSKRPWDINNIGYVVEQVVPRCSPDNIYIECT